MFAGGVLAWFVIMPMIAVFGGSAVLFPAKVTVTELFAEGGSFALWSTYIRYIGAGAVLTGGLIGLLESLPLIIRTFHDALGDFGQNGASTLRTEQDLSMKTLIGGILFIIAALWALPMIPLNAFGALLVAVFGFFFATVSSRMVGLIGSSNNPVSGMAIATLLVSALLLKNTGNDGAMGMVTAISIGGIICVVAAIAGDISQDLKTGFLVGATPKKQQIGEILGVICSAIAIGSIMYLLNSAWGYGSAELPAPQAMLMKWWLKVSCWGTCLGISSLSVYSFPLPCGSLVSLFWQWPLEFTFPSICRLPLWWAGCCAGIWNPVTLLMPRKEQIVFSPAYSIVPV